MRFTALLVVTSCDDFHRSNKAVAVGAISFYLDRFVKGRILRFTYGTPRNAPYSPSNPDHVRREHKTYINLMGEKRVRGAFHTMLSKVCMRSTLLMDGCDRYAFFRAPRFLKAEKSRERCMRTARGLHPRIFWRESSSTMAI